jgi:hypothetical protein
MNDAHPPLDRLTELLADRALFGLSPEEQVELDRLLENSAGNNVERLDRVAAAAQLAFLGGQIPLPTELRQKLAEAGKLAVSERPKKMARSSGQLASLPNRPAASLASRRELLAWLAVAASLLVAFLLGMRPTERVVAELSPAELRQELLASAGDDSAALTRVSWTPGPDESGKAATGEVTWSNDRQQGVMTFRGLPANNPREEQYQLWIFDVAQDEKYPVDGGVFDIPLGQDEVVVAIDAKLPITKPTLFAITIEKPGGVVVSSRERLPLLAQIK